MIEIHDLNKTYDRKVVLEIPGLTIQKGESIGLVGNNGAGKTTLLRLILDLIKATNGIVNSGEINVAQSDHWKSYTGAFLDDNFLITFLKPIEYFEFVGKIHGLSRADIREFLNENKLLFSEDVFNDKRFIRDLSKGNKNKVGILGAMINSPELIILDEPFANLDPSSQQWLMTKLKSLNDQGTTVIVSSHNLNQLSEISSRILLLENGKLIKDTENTTSTLSELESYFRVQVS